MSKKKKGFDYDAYFDEFGRRLRQFLTDSRVEVATRTSKELISVLASYNRTGKTKFDTITAIGAGFNSLREGSELWSSKTSYFVRDNGLKARSSVIPQLLKNLGLMEKLGFKKICKDEQTSLIGIRKGDYIFCFKNNDDKYLDYVYETPLKEGEESLGEKLITEAIWNNFNSLGLELTKEDKGELNLVPFEYSSKEYIGKQDPVKFADEVYRLREKGVGRACIFWGLPGTGKTSFVSSYAELTSSKMLVVGPSVFNVLSVSDLELIVDSIKPDILLFDDIDKAMNFSTAYSTIPNIREKYPNLLIIMTCNEISTLGSAMLRPGRSGELIQFPMPDVQERVKLLEVYMREAGVDSTKYDLTKLSKSMKNYTHDWVKSIADMSVCYDTQERLMAFVKNTNQKIELIEENTYDSEDAFRFLEPLVKGKRKKKMPPDIEME